MSKEEETVKENDLEEKDIHISNSNELQDEKSTSAEEREEQQDEVQELQDKLIRTLAEFDNFRKRTAKEKSTMYDEGVKSTIEKLLPVVDNFERALSSSEDEANSLYSGVELILKQIKNILKEIGIEEIESLGMKFDPNLHYGVAKISDDSLGENIVAEVMQKGYKYKDKVIRHSMVKVAN